MFNDSINYETFLSIKRLMDGNSILLNPSSHYNPEMDFYGQDLEIAFDVYHELSECDIRIVVPKMRR